MERRKRSTAVNDPEGRLRYPPAAFCWSAPVAAILLFALLAPQIAYARRGVGGEGLYSKEVYASAREKLARGDVKGATAEFCRMLNPRVDGDLWTLSVILLCHPENLPGQVAAVGSVQPVFVQEVDYKGLPCYRICAGLARDRSSLNRLARSIRIVEGGSRPFPVRVLHPCGSAGKGTNPPPGRTEGEEHHPRYLGPPVREPPRNDDGHGSEGAGRDGNRQGPGGQVPPKTSREAGNEGELLFRQGLEAYNAGRLKDAEVLYLRSLKADPGRAEVLNNLGVLYLKEGDYRRARPLFEQALKQSPAYAAAHLNLAGALWGLGEKDEAVLQAREAVELDQHDVNGYLTLASFYLSLGNKPAARDAANRVLLLDPGNEQARVFLSASEKKNGD